MDAVPSMLDKQAVMLPQALTPIYKKDDRRKVENYRPVSLLDNDSKVFEKCICSALYAHFEKFLTEHQHGFVK